MLIHAAKLPGDDGADRIIGQDMSLHDWDELGELLDKFFGEEKEEAEHAEDQVALTTSPNAGIPSMAMPVDDEDEVAQDEEAKAAGLVLLDPDGNALFLKRSDKGDEPGKWCWPGGHLDGEETPEEAAIRETREETAYIADEDADPVEEAAHRKSFVTFRQKVPNQFIPTLNDEHVAWAWAPLDSPPEPLHPGVEKTLDKIAEDAKVSQQAAQYQFEPKNHDCCAICTMFRGPDSCITVAGQISPQGWCKYFEKWMGAAVEEILDFPLPKRIDRNHDCQWMSELSVDGNTMYVDRSLPHHIVNNGKLLDVAQPLLRHEGAEFHEMKKRLAEFITKHGREPDEGERKQIYLRSHRTKGNPAEKTWVKENGYDWDSWENWCQAQIRRLSKEEVSKAPPDADVRPIPHGRGDLEFAGDRKILAFDRSLDLQKLDRRGIAFDFESVRHYSKDGHLHISRAPISKANVCPYIGYEIPNYEELGLDPNKIYKLLRDPEELKKGAATFNGKPLLQEHVPVDAKNHDFKDTLGATGTDAEFEDPYLYNSLVVWTDEGIDPIETERKKELSSAYHYDADMRPGTFKGEKYDGVMRNIIGNHVALVREGRAGADVVIGDSAITDPERIMSAKPIILTRKAAVTLGALVSFLKPKLAKDAAINFYPVLTGVTHKNFKEKKAGIVEAIKKQTEGKLAKDANISGLVELIDALEGEAPAEAGAPDAVEMDPNTGTPMEAKPHEGGGFPEGGEGGEGEPAPGAAGAEGAGEGEGGGGEQHEALKSFLSSKGMSEDDIDQACKLAGGKGMAGDEEDEDDKPHGMDDPEPFKGMPETGGKMAGDSAATAEAGNGKGGKEKKVTHKEMKVAMDAAVKVAVEQAKKEAREQYEKDIKLATDAANKNAQQIRDAENEVRPWVGAISVACDSAEMVYQTALEGLGVNDAKQVKDLTALKAILKHVPQPGVRKTAEHNIAMDSGAISDFAKRNPLAARIETVI